jgi:hypothetical protein
MCLSLAQVTLEREAKLHRFSTTRSHYDNRHSAPSILHLLDEVRSQGNVVVLDENLVSLLSENLGGNGGHRAPVCQAAQAALRARSRCSRLEFRSSRTGETAKNSRGHKRASGARSPAAGPTVDC